MGSDRMEFKVAINGNFKISVNWQGKLKSINLGWLSLQIKTGQYIPLGYAGRGIYKYR
jgi:hypothetical protein